MNEIRKITAPTNAAQDDIETGVPYVVSVRLRGVADLLLHRWNP